MFTIRTSDGKYQYSIDDGSDGDPPCLQIWVMRPISHSRVWTQVMKVSADQLSQALEAYGLNPPDA